MRKTFWIALALFSLAAPLDVFAYEVKRGPSVLVGKDEIIDGNLFAAGSNIQIDGTVRGDVFCAGQTISITGLVEGNVFCAGQTMSISSQIDGDLVGAGQSLNFRGDIARNLVFAGQSITTDSSSGVGWQAILAGETIDLGGQIDRDLLGAGSKFRISGNVGRNADLWLDRSGRGSLVVAPTGVITGDLTYHARSEAQLEAGSQVIGKTDFRKLDFRPQRPPQGAWIGKWLYGAVSSFVIGLLFILLWPKRLQDLLDEMKKGTKANFGWGLVLALLSPLVALLLAFTLIGLPLAVLIVLSWLILMWLSKILVAAYIGRLAVEKWLPSKRSNLYWMLALGVLIAYFFYGIPFIGGLISFVAVIYGLGSLYLYVEKN